MRKFFFLGDLLFWWLGMEAEFIFKEAFESLANYEALGTFEACFNFFPDSYKSSRNHL